MIKIKDLVVHYPAPSIALGRCPVDLGTEQTYTVISLE